MKFNNKTKPQNDKKKQEKEIVYENLKCSEARERLLDGFESILFPIKSKGSGLLNTDCSKLKMLTPK